MSIYSSVRSALRIGTLKVLAEYFPTKSAQDKAIIYSHTSGTEPSVPYVVIQIVSVNQVGKTSYSTYASSAENLTIINHYEIMAQFSFCGTTAGDMAYDFNNSIINNTVTREAFQLVNLAPINKSTLRRVPSKRDTAWVEYENLDVTFTYAVKTNQAVDIIEHISLLDPETQERLYIPPLPVTP